MSIISYEDFEKIHLRSGTVVKAELFQKTKKPAYKVWVDFGPDTASNKPQRRSQCIIPLKTLSEDKSWGV